MTRAPCVQVPECVVFEHELFSHAAWAPFKQRVLEHVAEQANSLTQSAVVARADNEAIGAIGACLTSLCTQVGALTTLFGGLQRTADDMMTDVTDVVRETMRETIRDALLRAAGAVVEAPGGAAHATYERPERARSPPRPPAPPAQRPRQGVKAYLDLGKVATVGRLHEEYYVGDSQTNGAPLKNMTVRFALCAPVGCINSCTARARRPRSFPLGSRRSVSRSCVRWRAYTHSLLPSIRQPP